MSGRDQPHVPSKKPAQTVHFTFMTGGGYDDEPPVPAHCPRCRWPVPSTNRFCGQCGHEQMMDVRMPSRKRVKKSRRKMMLRGGKPLSQRLVHRRSPLRCPSKRLWEQQQCLRVSVRRCMGPSSCIPRNCSQLSQACPRKTRRICKGHWKRMRRSRPTRTSNLLKNISLGWPIQTSSTSIDTGETSLMKNGRIAPSKAAPAPTEKQAQCTQAFESLRWGANQEGHYAKCTDCGLRSVIYWSSKNGALMLSLAHERPEGIPAQTKVWVREDEMSETLQMVNLGGPTDSQVRCRVTKATQGQALKKDD